MTPALHPSRSTSWATAMGKDVAPGSFVSSSNAPRLRRASYNRSVRNRSAFAMTDTELNVIAALAIIGLRSSPNTG